MKHFTGHAEMQYKQRGTSEYALTKDTNNETVIMVRGTFTITEMSLLVQAATLGMMDFELHDTRQPNQY